MSRFASDRKLMPILSRFMSRWLHAHAEVFFGSRIRATFAVAAILVGIHATIGIERASFAETIDVTRAAAPMRALHSVPSYRTAPAPRPSSRVPSGTAAALPENRYDALGPALISRAFTTSRLEQPSTSVVSRGYDATAPPTLS